MPRVGNSGLPSELDYLIIYPSLGGQSWTGSIFSRCVCVTVSDERVIHLIIVYFHETEIVKYSLLVVLLVVHLIYRTVESTQILFGRRQMKNFNV